MIGWYQYLDKATVKNAPDIVHFTKNNPNLLKIRKIDNKSLRRKPLQN